MQCLKGKPIGIILLHENGIGIIDWIWKFLKNHINMKNN